MLFTNKTEKRVGVRLARKYYEADPGETIDIPERYAYAIKLQGIPLELESTVKVKAAVLVVEQAPPEPPVAPQEPPPDATESIEDEQDDESQDDSAEPVAPTADGAPAAPKLTKAQRRAAKAAAAAAAAAK